VIAVTHTFARPWLHCVALRPTHQEVFMSRLMLVCAAVVGLSTALPAAAQFQKPEDAVKYRKAGMSMMATHFGRIGAMASGRAPFDAAAAAANADIVVFLSKLPFAGFASPEAGSERTRAKPNIWTERAKFDAAAARMQDDVVKLAAAAKANNLDQLKAAFGSAAGSCKACHDSFWVE
jgi:cytochrome c556